MTRAADSNTAQYRAKAEPGSNDYVEKVARPIMDAVDDMPKEYRECVHDFGYVDVYRAWKRGWSVERIREAGKSGRFEFAG